MTGLSRLILMTAILISSGRALATQMPDFTGATIVERGFCKVEDDTVECMEIDKDTKRYLIFHEGYIIYFIFGIKEGAVKPYTPEWMEQIFPPKRAEGVAI